MIVGKSKFHEVVAALRQPGEYGLDTETTGLRRSDRLFSIILADARQGYYFNFNEDLAGKSDDPEFQLPRSWIEQMAPIVENEASLFFAHNAKFDLGMLSREGLYVLGAVHCTEAAERLVKNNILGHRPYSLASCAARRGLAKDVSVDEHIKKHKLFTEFRVAGKDKTVRLPRFERVPFEIITKYGETDAILARAIGLDQLRELAAADGVRLASAPPIMGVLANERKLTKACWRIEETGIPINRPYTQKALDFVLRQAETAEKSFEAETGMPFQDSAAVLKAAFAKSGVELPKTATGKPATNKKTLEELDHPLAARIREIRGYKKLASTYYSSFLYYADADDMLHANIRQGGTETGRFSYSDPNLQNLPKEDEEADRGKPYIVRRSFVPRPDFCFVPIDFRQQEFRVMLDYAGETKLIADIMAGEDVHEATAQLLGIKRKAAKTINFGLLYGMGPQKLADSLKITLSEARELRTLYFERLPAVKAWIDTVVNVGKHRGYCFNWFGFRNRVDADYAYVFPNHLIQGSCAQILRVAMVRIDEYCREHRLRSHMVAQVHDELLFHVHASEREHVPTFQAIMEQVYPPKNGVSLACSVEHSWKSWGKRDMTPGPPT